MSNEKINELRSLLTPRVGFELFTMNESLTKERDTYRDLCVELLEDLKSQVDGFGSMMGKKSLADSEELITKAESILGESNAT